MFKLFWLTAVLPLLIFARETYIYPPDGPELYANCQCNGTWVKVDVNDSIINTYTHIYNEPFPEPAEIYYGCTNQAYKSKNEIFWHHYRTQSVHIPACYPYQYCDPNGPYYPDGESV